MMICYSSVTIALCSMILPLVGGLPFSSIGLGVGKASQGDVFGTSNVYGSGNFASIGTGASGKGVSGSTSVISPVQATDKDVSLPIGSPEAAIDIELSSILNRGLQAAVPDYRDTSGSSEKSYATGASENKTSHPNTRDSSEKPGIANHPKVCWTMSKRCCYEEVQKGYECKDFYAHKYTRCHPVIEYEAVCGKIEERPAHHPRPKGRVKYEETVLKNYDARYGPHVTGYPENGESEYYKVDTIPVKPRGVSGTPVSAPQSYQSKSGSTTNEAYMAEEDGEDIVSIVPYETKSNRDQQYGALGDSKGHEKKAANLIPKSTENATAGAEGSYEVKPQPTSVQSLSKTSAANADTGSGGNGPGVSEQSLETYNVGTAQGGNGPSYRILK
ncbi:unnamed protein product [Agarophyton chilense]